MILYLPGSFAHTRRSEEMVYAFTGRGASSWIDHIMISREIDTNKKSYEVWDDFDMFGKAEDHWPSAVGIT